MATETIQVAVCTFEGRKVPVWVVVKVWEASATHYKQRARSLFYPRALDADRQIVALSRN